ncbi:flagellar export chaperone FliS [Xanthomonas campestris pv. phormiicola]|nr:flagellar export chaperone FliS [Xanthomonas campestris pv. phormiicola]UYC17871.1 flagellar export chaperone FliS [Xanthomonas campestris pv. phormiicola]
MDSFGYGQYQSVELNTQIVSASPVQLVLVLTNGLLDEFSRLRAHIGAARFEAKGASINKCIDLLTALSSSLDVDQGGQPVADLARLYEYMMLRLNEAGIAMDSGMVDEVESLVLVLRQGWQALEACNG